MLWQFLCLVNHCYSNSLSVYKIFVLQTAVSSPQIRLGMLQHILFPPFYCYSSITEALLLKAQTES